MPAARMLAPFTEEGRGRDGFESAHIVADDKIEERLKEWLDR